MLLFSVTCITPPSAPPGPVKNTVAGSVSTGLHSTNKALDYLNQFDEMTKPQRERIKGKACQVNNECELKYASQVQTPLTIADICCSS